MKSLSAIICINLCDPQRCPEGLQAVMDHFADVYHFECACVDSVAALFDHDRFAIRIFYADCVNAKVLDNLTEYEARIQLRSSEPRLSFALFDGIPAKEKTVMMARLSLINYVDLQSGVEYCCNALLDNCNALLLDHDYALSVAIVDDCSYMRDQIKMVLTAHNKSIHCECFHSAEALLMAEKEVSTPFSLYIVDMVMEGISGVDLIRQLRVQHPRAVILAVSQLQNPKIISTAMRMGANDYFPKPIDMSILARRALAVYAMVIKEQVE